MIVAEGLVRSAEEIISALLQWGRNLIVAEGRHHNDGGIPDRRFNGAAT